jgi:hypothetical protein
MRWLAANLLWEKKGIQVPLLWEIPSERPHGVLVTGDVHQDANDIQIRAARLMAERMEPNAIPLSLFIEGRLGAKVSSHVGALRGMPHVELEAHSNDGSVYSPRTKKYVVGAENVLRDINQARAGLGITKEHQEAGGLTAMRTHGWSTDEDSVSALHGAGVGLLLDQMSDLAMHKDHNTPLRFWFRAPVNRRLFVPLAERSISTASDDFVLSDELLGEMVSIPSPQCDPCCNDEVSWDDYQAYVEKFHLAFDRLATMGGLAEIWLFHPSTPAVKAGMTSLIEFLNRIRRAPTVVFLQGDAFATWLANREISSVRPVLDGSGRLRAMSLHNKESLRMLPPGSPPDYKRAYFWVLGESSVPGWAASAWKDPFERTVTVLHASTEAP